ncbi:Hsp20/alpha crystallin family protein [Pectinatus cerevisiiphilus]|uniref:HSP20 family protein n=1 Tax=Pectinatus cerevisiiphilus TaxID=86956 RepID=A0A4R3KBC1_9FIRM|nr:Hsp20/alpha crystallin family protein [Pectinatus cerevisiiphilus]TCS80454.1 HSP20 family protein [Pectinatus cerevisiiphilus]
MFGLVPFAKNNAAKKDDAFGRLFDFFNEPFFNSAIAPVQTAMSGFASFKVDVKDVGDSYELSAELPGVKKEDISLSYDNGYLTIEANTKDENEEKDDTGKYIRRERRCGSMSRSFYIDNINDAQAKAEFKDGILTIKLPKTTPTDNSKHINIE